MSNKIAAVIIDSDVPHLDHEFDYLIPEQLSNLVQPGIRVRVPFRKRRLDGFVVAIKGASDRTGALVELENVISPEVVLTDEVLNVCRLVAFRNVGNLYDVIKVAVPQRHKRAESGFKDANSSVPNQGLSAIEHYPDLNRFLDSNQLDKIAVLNLAISDTFDYFILDLVKKGIKNTIFLLPDQYDVKRLVENLSIMVDPSRISTITSSLPPEARYKEFLKVLRGVSDLIVGTRNSVFSPLKKLEQIFVFDDGDDLYTSPQSPYWNSRDVAIWRSEISTTKVILASRAQSIESRQLVKSGSAVEINCTNKQISSLGRVVDDSLNESSIRTRIPSDTFNLIRKSLFIGSVLVSIPRKGYLPLVRCINCANLFDCPKCKYRISLSKDRKIPQCARCGNVVTQHICHKCGGIDFRSVVVGVERTAEELGKAFPNTLVKYLDFENRPQVYAQPNQLIIATPGVEPNIEFSGIVVLDSFLSLARPEGNSRIRFIRHLFSLRSKLIPGREMQVIGDPSNSLLQAFVKSNNFSVADDLLQERIETRLNPYSRTAQVFGDRTALSELQKELPEFAQVWGPVENTILQMEKHPASILVSVPKNSSESLVKLLRSWVVTRSINRKKSVLVRIDPDDI